MEQKYGVKSSYRYRVDGASGRASPIAVWSPSALRDNIIKDHLPAGAPRKEHP